MGRYEVVVECYVPVGAGFRYKRPGQVVTLSDEDAASLGRHLKSVDSDGVAKRNTQPEAVEPTAQPAAKWPFSLDPSEPAADESSTEWSEQGEVVSDVGDPTPGDE